MFSKLFNTNRYDDDYEDEGSFPTAEIFTPPERLKICDFLISIALGIVCFLFVCLRSYGSLYPTAWNDCAIAAGLASSNTICPGLWYALSSFIYGSAGIEGGNAAISFLGMLSGGVVAALSYLVFKQILSLLVRMIDPLPVWNRFFMRLLPCVATILFVFSQPIWMLFHAFTPTAFAFCLFLTALCFYLTFLSQGTLWPGYLAMFLTGLMCAETPFGFLLLACFWFVFHLLLKNGKISHIQFLEPLTQQSSKWFLTFFLVLGLVAGVAANVKTFISSGAAAIAGVTPGDIPVLYISNLWDAFLSSATIGGWIVGTGVAFLPFILAISLLRRGTDVEYFLSYHVGVVFLMTSLVAYSQLCSLPALWFWTFPTIAVNSDFMKAIFSFMSSVAVFAGLCIVFVDVYCRDHRKLALQLNPEIIPDERNSKVRRIMRDVFVGVLLLSLVAGVLANRTDAQSQRMLTIIDAYVDEVVAECSGVKYLFTDGEFGSRVELEAAKRGQKLYCASIVPKAEGRNVASLKSTFDSTDERIASDVSGANLLVAMMGKGRSDIAVQYWLDIARQKTGRNDLAVAGVLARPEWADPSERAKCIAKARDIAKMYCDFYSRYSSIHDGVDPVLRHYFQIAQFRLQSMAGFRLKDARIGRKTPDAGVSSEELSDREMMDRLNKTNGALQELKSAVENAQKHVMNQVTPADALMLALARADFAAGRRHAERILKTSPDDPRANFMMGMYSFSCDNFADAEKYFKECIRYNRREISYWNNLAMAQMKLGNFAEARKSINTAKGLVGNIVHEIKDTLVQIEEAEKAGGK